LLFIGNLFANAQPVLNAADVETGFFGSIYIGDTSGFSEGNAGENQVWDFSGLTLTPVNVTVSTVPVTTTPFANQIPTSNYCWKIINSIDPNNISTNYQFHSLSNTSFEKIGSTENSDVIKYTDSEILFQFPYTYNKVINDTYKIDGNQDSGSFTTVYDAYGTLKTPFATHTNIIRQKRTEGPNIRYDWFQTNPFSNLMEIGLRDGVIESIIIFKNTPGLGLNQMEAKKSMAVFPNPTHAELNLQLPEQQTLDRIAITDVTGKIVMNQDNNLKQINVSNLANGLYFIEAHSGKEKFLTKFIKN
jgi:hypothetical protein